MHPLIRSLIAAGLPLVLITASSPGDPPPATSGAPDDAVATHTARSVMEKVTADALVVLRDHHLTAREKHGRITAIADQSMDFKTLARLSLGRNWRPLTDAQRSEFVDVFKQHVANTYGHAVDQYNDEDVTIAGDREESDSDWTVKTRIVGKTADGAREDVAKVDYRLRQTDGYWRIIDVTIDGVSMVANFRAQFQDIMENGGIDRLIKLLRDKNAAADK